MNQYVTGAMIKRLREERNLTQAELAEKLHVSDKTVSKWETGKGYPDIAMIEPLAGALGISVAELLAGEDVVNTNKAFNMLRLKIYVCPVCGNVITACGESVISCCGITLPMLEAEDADEEHILSVENIEDEYYLTMDHPMTKDHYISFILGVSDNGASLTKLYPEGNCEAYVKRSRTRFIYYYCNRDGLFKMKIKR